MTTHRWWGSGVLGVALAVGTATSGWAAVLLVDDFDRGEKPNALGGDFGAWNKDPDDPTQYCRNSFDQPNAYGGVGYSLRLDYDVDSPNPAYNGFWAKLQNADARPYKTLSFYIKGEGSKGYTSQIKVELKNTTQMGRAVVKGVTDQWQRISIPLQEFAGLTDFSQLTEFVIVFDDVTATKKVGTIYIDEVAFE